MKDILKIVFGLVVFISVSFLIYYFYSNSKEIPNIENPIVIENPLLGCYIATLSKDIYVISLVSDSGNKVKGMLAFNNYEKDSSSGSFDGTYNDGILLGTYSFDSEGTRSDMPVIFKKVDNGFVRGFGDTQFVNGVESFKDISSIKYDTTYTFTKNLNCISEFKEVNDKFTIKYNPLFKAYAPSVSQNTTEWRKDSLGKGLVLAKIFIPKVYMSGTNFSSASLNIGSSSDPKEIAVCSEASLFSGEISQGNKDINNFSFTRFYVTDAGAGNYYETTSYRGLLDGDCYVLEYTIHSTNINNYSAEQNIQEFDKQKIQNEFESIIDSFVFLVNSD